MYKTLIIITLFLSFTFSKAQNTLILKRTLPIQNITHFSFDKKGNIFAADKNSTIYKYDTTGKEIFHYSPNRPTEIVNFEATNTSQILVFSEERQEYLILDWLLSPISNESFDVAQFAYVSIVGQSATNLLWVLDNVNFTLSKYNIQTKKKVVETNLEFLVTNGLRPLFIKENDNFVYISTEKNGILVFDNLGNYKKKLPYNNIDFFDFINGNIYWNTNGEVTFFHLMHFQEYKTNVVQVGRLIIQNNDYYFLQKDKISIFNYETGK